MTSGVPGGADHSAVPPTAPAGPSIAPVGPAVPARPSVESGGGAHPGWARRPELWVTALIVVVDQITKLLVLRNIPLHDTVVVIPGLLNFTYVRNTGAAFGMLNAHDFAYKSVLVALLAMGALAGIVWYARKFAGDAWAARFGFALIVAGALGNLIDRVLLGFVVDFVDVVFGTWHFWAFNVADAAINIGAVLFIADTLFSRRHVPETV